MNQQTKTTKPILVNIREASALLGLSTRSIQNYIQIGALRSVKIGKRRLLPLAALEVFARRDHAVPARAEARREACTEDEGKEHS